MTAVDMLTYFGLTRQEATIYLTLNQEGSLTGYEAAKHTGISRSNTYTALAGLVDKGAAYVMEAKATHYLPVPVEEFCENRLKRLSQMADCLIEAVPGKADFPDGYITVKGRLHILDKAANMIRQAQHRVYICAGSSVIQWLLPALASQGEQGKKIVVVSSSPVSGPWGTFYLSKTPIEQLRLIADSAKVLTGDALDESSTCLYSEKKNLVDLIKVTIKNEIELIQLEK